MSQNQPPQAPQPPQGPPPTFSARYSDNLRAIMGAGVRLVKPGQTMEDVPRGPGTR